MTFGLVITVMATLAGAVHAMMVCLALQGVIRIENAELAAWCSRAIRPTFQVFAPLAAAHYVLHGYDHGLILTSAYCVAMGVFLMKRPDVESRPFSDHPRDLDGVLSRASMRWLSWLTTPALCVPAFILAMTVNAAS